MMLNEALHIDPKRIDREILSLVKHDPGIPSDSVIGKSIAELVESGGKRLRPMMVIVGSRFGPRPSPRKTLQLAAIAEFIHAASLIHDDIIDRSDTRRNRPALHTKVGIQTAVHTANYMMARVVELLSQYSKEHDRYVQDFSAITTTQLCIGEYQQLNHRFDFDVTEEVYLEKTGNKTAQLMATCLKVGAKSSDASDAVADKLYQFGECLGMSFQIRDDLLDFTQPSEQLGKPAGSDLINGQVTLPVLYALDLPELGPKIRSLTFRSTGEEIAEIVEEIRSSRVLDKVEALSDHYLDRAKTLIGDLHAYPAYRDLEHILHFFADRKN
ncbi:polyprenyl synthetase family protein [Paenibacillus larvae]